MKTRTYGPYPAGAVLNFVASTLRFPALVTLILVAGQVRAKFGCKLISTIKVSRSRREQIRSFSASSPDTYG